VLGQWFVNLFPSSVLNGTKYNFRIEKSFTTRGSNTIRRFKVVKRNDKGKVILNLGEFPSEFKARERIRMYKLKRRRRK